MNDNVKFKNVVRICKSPKASNKTNVNTPNSSSDTSSRIQSDSYQKSLQRLREKSSKFDW